MGKSLSILWDARERTVDPRTLNQAFQQPKEGPPFKAAPVKCSAKPIRTGADKSHINRAPAENRLNNGTRSHKMKPSRLFRNWHRRAEETLQCFHRNRLDDAVIKI